MAIKHEKSQQPENSLPQTRRSALKKMLVGTGVAAGAVTLPSKWVKPVVNKVLVPAHAQTSPEPSTTASPQPQPTTTPCPVEYSISCEVDTVRVDTKTESSLLAERQECFKFSVSGEVTATCGASVAGLGVTIEAGYEGQSMDPFTVNTDQNGMFEAEIEGEFCVSCEKNGTAGATGNGTDYTLSVSVELEGQTGVNSQCEATLECRPEPSDIRLKTHVYPLGVTKEGFQLYRFRYKNDPSGKAYVGVMAQDLADTHPHALVKNTNGYFAVRYDRLGLKMATFKEWQQSGLRAVELVN